MLGGGYVFDEIMIILFVKIKSSFICTYVDFNTSILDLLNLKRSKYAPLAVWIKSKTSSHRVLY